jgi:hypothetical protein
MGGGGSVGEEEGIGGEERLIGGCFARWFCLQLQSHVTHPKHTQVNDEWTRMNMGPACSCGRVE